MQKRGFSWTSARQALAKPVARGEGCDGLRRRGVWRNSGGRFSARPLAVTKQWQARTFATAERIQYDPKVIAGAKTLDPKGDAYYGS